MKGDIRIRKPYRVIVWGPGAVGRGCLRELVRRPEFEVVGVVGYGPDDKVGEDVGELINHAPIGLKVSSYSDKESMFTMDADCVVWTGTFPSVDVAEQMDSDVIRLLESGKHVVTSVAYHYPPSHGPDYLKKFEDACQKGKSCLHGTGELPGFWFERVALTLTGVCNDVEYIKLDEYADTSLSGTSAEILNYIGYGVPPEEALGTADLSEAWKSYYYVEALNIASMSLYGRPLERFEHEPSYYLAEEEFVLDKKKGDPVDLHVPKGSIKAMTHSFHGYIDGRPRLNINVNWFITPAFSPFPGKEDSTWDIEIEGRPTSLKCTMRALASFKDNLMYRPGDPISPAWYATAVPIVKAIPVVCSHEPGIVYASTFAGCAPDLRLLETRKSIVG